MTEKEKNKYTRRRLEIKRRKEQRKKIMSILVALVFTSLLAFGIGLFCRHLLMQYSIGEVPAAAAPSVQQTAAESVEYIQINESQPRWAVDELTNLQLFYSAYVHGNGWNIPHRDNSFCMAAAGEYVTAMNIRVQNQVEGMTGTIEYNVNVSGSGWQGWTANGETGGITDTEQPLEALRIRLTGELGEYYDIYYSVLQDNVWTEWVKNGQDAGLAAAGKRVDGFRVSSLKKADSGKEFPGGVDPSKPMVALTYDDGPNRTTTPRLLEILEENDARATFFMVGSRVEGHSDIVRQMKAQGCEPANHTMNHVAMKRASVEEYVEQLRNANEAVFNACGVTPVLMRPCEGSINEAGLKAVGSLGMSSIMWNVDTLDWKTRDVQKTIDAVLNDVKDGDIILMHDLYESTVEASETIIPELISRGYQLVTVSEMAACRGGILPGKNYGSFRRSQ